VNSAIVWGIISTIILIIVGAICIIALKRKGKQEPNYYIFLILAIIWFPLGIIADNLIFMILGFLFFAISLIHRDKWDRPEYLIQDKIWRYIIISLALLVLIALMVSYLVVKKGL
jgi:hypothetical protein